jgi:hypothetical protein
VTGQLNVTTELMSRNVKIFISDTLLRNEALEAPLEQIKQIACEALTVPFAQDWRQRAVDSGYLVRGNVKLETPSQLPLRPSTQSFKAPPTPARSSVPPNTPTPTVSSHLVAGSGFGFDYTPFPLSATMSESSVTTSADTFGSPAGASTSGALQKLSDDVLDLVETLSGYRNPNHIAIIEDILDNVPRSQWDKSMRKRLKVNAGTAKALYIFLKQC